MEYTKEHVGIVDYGWLNNKPGRSARCNNKDQHWICTLVKGHDGEYHVGHYDHNGKVGRIWPVVEKDYSGSWWRRDKKKPTLYHDMDAHIITAIAFPKLIDALIYIASTINTKINYGGKSNAEVHNESAENLKYAFKKVFDAFADKEGICPSCGST